MEQANIAADMDGPVPKPAINEDFAYSVASAFAIGCYGVLLLLM